MPVYDFTFEEVGKYRDEPVLPFNAFGTLAMARRESDANSASSQFFFCSRRASSHPRGPTSWTVGTPSSGTWWTGKSSFATQGGRRDQEHQGARQRRKPREQERHYPSRRGGTRCRNHRRPMSCGCHHRGRHRSVSKPSNTYNISMKTRKVVCLLSYYKYHTFESSLPSKKYDILIPLELALQVPVYCSL